MLWRKLLMKLPLSKSCGVSKLASNKTGFGEEYDPERSKRREVVAGEDIDILVKWQVVEAVS
jgi:hypothetical protein